MPRKAKYKPLKKGSRNLNYKNCLRDLKTLPSVREVHERYKSLQIEMNGSRISRILFVLANELIDCWKKQDMPHQSRQCVLNKLNRLFKKKSSKHFNFFCNFSYIYINYFLVQNYPLVRNCLTSCLKDQYGRRLQRELITKVKRRELAIAQAKL